MAMVPSLPTFIAVGVGGTILQSDSLFNNPPSKPTLIYPADAQTDLGMTITFRWEKSADPDGDTITYHLYICENQNFTGCNPLYITALDKNSLL